MSRGDRRKLQKSKQRHSEAEGYDMATAEKIPGEWEAWAGKWEWIKNGPNRCLYTTGTPATSGQRYLRGYWRALEPHVKPGWVCCELGAGRGTTSQYLAAKGHSVTLVDLAENGLEVACSNFAEHTLPPPACIVANVERTGLDAGGFDLVHSVGLLEHFDDPRPVLKESWRLLRQGGLMFHVIIAERQNDVYRTEHKPSDFVRFAAECGFEAECKPMIVHGVSRLMAWRT